MNATMDLDIVELLRDEHQDLHELITEVLDAEPLARSEPFHNLVDRLAALWRWADRDPDRPLLSALDGDRFRALTAAEVRASVRAIAAGLISVGVARSDRVLLLSRTRRE